MGSSIKRLGGQPCNPEPDDIAPFLAICRGRLLDPAPPCVDGGPTLRQHALRETELLAAFDATPVLLATPA